MDADLRSYFSWNVKQLFVFLVAEYSTPDNVLNEVVVDDFIIVNKSSAHIEKDPGYTKYPISDKGYALRGNNITFKLYWDVMPITGFLHLDHVPAMDGVFQLPKEYRE